MKVFVQVMLIVSLITGLLAIVGKMGISSLGIGGDHIPPSKVEKIVD